MENFVTEWIRSGVIFSSGSGQLLIGWGKRKWSKHPDSFYPSFYFPDYFLQHENCWFEHEHYQEVSIAHLLEQLCLLSEIDSSENDYCWKNPYRDFFNQAFKDLQKKIALGELEKGVPYIIESAECPKDQVQLVKSLKAVLKYIQNNMAYLYGFWDQEEGMLGASPEVLFRYDGKGILETMACAGTRNINENSQALLSDAKELYEHELVVRGITQSLSAYGKVTAGELHLLKLSQLMHLVTPLTVKLYAELPYQKMVEVFHPTPAVGAFPKKEGRQWLEQYQQSINRARFGAPVGYVHPKRKQSNCYVAIRNVQWDNNRMQIAAGCGVVRESRFEKEWAEIHLKLKAIKEMLAL